MKEMLRGIVRIPKKRFLGSKKISRISEDLISKKEKKFTFRDFLLVFPVSRNILLLYGFFFVR